DPTTGILYMTEDRSDGRFYRYVPSEVVEGVSDLTAGTLEVLRIESGAAGAVAWETVPDPAATDDATREQVPTSTAFAGGEGIAYHDGIVYFTTKGDNRVWAYSVAGESIEVVYDAEALDGPILTG